MNTIFWLQISTAYLTIGILMLIIVDSCGDFKFSDEYLSRLWTLLLWVRGYCQGFEKNQRTGYYSWSITMLEVNNIYQGDCLDLLKQLEDESINLVITSPPYKNLRQYSVKSQIWGGSLECNHEWID